ncbi:hypothetical protein HPB48_014389 [Haemaphysalis longicornis]|uniref:Tudor domain-containing protein n=1 Tax=Haemaphysalis longicornis TaxID=44386 RepID=A0A9J6GDB7_HAELO|nr:hypothetical protein HPB48_014389 [Haemaphysalis longicornis]
MACLVRQDTSTRLAFRALVADVVRTPSGLPLKVHVLYVDSGQTKVVGFDRLYVIDAESAAKPKGVVACSIRRVKPTDASSSSDLQHLWQPGTLFEAVFYTACDAGLYEVDLYAKCRVQKSGWKTYDVAEHLLENGFAKLVDTPAVTPEAVKDCTQGASSADCDPAHFWKSLEDPMKPPPPPEVGSFVLGHVSAVFSPNCFYLNFPYGLRSIEQLSSECGERKSEQILATLTSELQHAYKASFRVSRHKVSLGEVVAAQSLMDGRWYRARVVKVEVEHRLDVLYVDFGFCESLPCHRVKPLEYRFTKVPQQAVQACLVTKKPTWDENSCRAFDNLVSGKDLVVETVRVFEGIVFVRLFFLKNGEQPRSVARVLKENRKTGMPLS